MVKVSYCYDSVTGLFADGVDKVGLILGERSITLECLARGKAAFTWQEPTHYIYLFPYLEGFLFQNFTAFGNTHSFRALAIFSS